MLNAFDGCSTREPRANHICTNFSHRRNILQSIILCSISENILFFLLFRQEETTKNFSYMKVTKFITVYFRMFHVSPELQRCVEFLFGCLQLYSCQIIRMGSLYSTIVISFTTYRQQTFHGLSRLADKFSVILQNFSKNPTD